MPAPCGGDLCAAHFIVTAEAESPATVWFVYVLRCGDGSLYCGITSDLARRLQQHQTGVGARYTRGRGPIEMVAHWVYPSRSAALKAELAFKRLSRAAKEARLCGQGEAPGPSALEKG